MKQAAFNTLCAIPTRNGIYKSKEFHGDGTPIINMGELFAYERIGGQAMKRLRVNFKELQGFGVENGDLLFARRSVVADGVGKCSIIQDLVEPTVFESSIIRARLDRSVANPMFYYYYFQSPEGRDRVKSISTGAAIMGITGSALRELQVPIVSLPTQRKVAAVLSAYDDLIENNTRRVKVLEQMARDLYREWFVEFRFPGHETAEFVEDEHGRRPEGWEWVTLTQVAATNFRSLKKGKTPDEVLYIDLSSVGTGVIEAAELMPFADAPGRARRLVRHGDTIWATVRPNRRSFALVLNPDIRLVVSTGFAVLTPTRVPYTYLYATTTTEAFSAYLVGRARGAAYPAVVAQDFEEAPLLLPDEATLQLFHTRIEAVALQQENLRVRNANLRRTRDLLLPKLVSGELDVSALDVRGPGLELVDVMERTSEAVA